MRIYISTIFIIIFLSIFSYFYSEEYFNYHKNKQNLQTQNDLINHEISNFTLSKIRDLEKIQLFYTPNKDLLNKIVEKINNAKTKIYIEVYILTETRIQKALKKAKDKWIDIKIILEKNPYKTTNINKKVANFFEKNNINFVWSNANNYSLNHSKMILIDDESIISTWNLTYSTFNNNRDFFLFITDKEINLKFNKIFLSDYKWEKTNIYDNNLILSPFYSRKKFEILIKSAKSDIKMYFQYFKDKKINNLLIKRKKEWIQIESIISKQSLNSNKKDLDKLIHNWINISILNKNNMHAKAILIDNKYLFIWSINLSNYSLDKNREIWILLTNTKIINNFINIFKSEKVENILLEKSYTNGIK